MAEATSDASARVGVGAWIINSSICVATMLGLPAFRQARTMRRWIGGTCSGGISTPRSPRATITASESATMASRCSMAEGFSSFEITPARPATMPRISCHVLWALHEGQGDPVRAELEGVGQVGPVLGREGRERQDGADDADALAVGQRATDDDAGPGLAGALQETTSSLTLPSSSRSCTPGGEGLEDLRMRHADALLVTGSAVQVEAELGPGGERHRPSAKVPTRSFGPCRSARTPMGRPDLPLDGADGVVALLMVLVRAVAEVEPEHVRPGLEKAADDLRAGAGGAEGGDDLGVAMTAHVSSRPERPPFLAGRMRMARKSLTLVSVGPVMTWSPRASKKPCPSLSARRALALIPRPAARASVSGVTTAPATSSAPSTPSVSPASANTPGRPSSSTARDEQELDIASAASTFPSP